MTAEMQARNAQRYLAMESEVFDVGQMASATALLLASYMEEKRKIVTLGPMTAAELVEFLKCYSEAVDFMVHRLDDMARGLERHFE